MKKITAFVMAVLLAFVFTACGEKEDYSVSEKIKLPAYGDGFEIKANIFDYDFDLQTMGKDSVYLDENNKAILGPVIRHTGGYENYEIIGFVLDVDTRPGVAVFYNRDGQINVSLEKADHDWKKANIHDNDGYITHTRAIDTETTLAYHTERDDKGNIKMLQVQKQDTDSWITLMEHSELK